MEYTVRIPQQHLLAILNLLQTVPAPMNQTYPIYEPLLRQMQEQDAASALPVAGVFVDDDTSESIPEPKREAPKMNWPELNLPT